MLFAVGVIAVLGIGGSGYALKKRGESTKAHDAFMVREEDNEKKNAETAAMKKSEEAAM